MTEEKRLPELLSPCGSPEALTAAITAGADAVYFGGTMLNARMNAKNFDRSAIVSAISVCHEKGVRAYVTLNTQIFDRELSQALSYAAFLYEAGVDALIIADAGLSRLIRTHIPALKLHASTQMTGHSVQAARAFASLGFERMVCAREMSGEQIAELVKESPIEIEMFVHGAMCVSCSGQCMLSAVMGGRSGNRGECAQPCRLPYSGGNPISLRDMCLAPHIPELISMGVSSLKIEGRMKSPAYVHGVTRIYRRLLDENRAAAPAEIGELAKLFSRGGFTDGYFTGKISNSMLGVRSEADKGDSRAAASSPEGVVSHRLPRIEVTERRAPVLPDKVTFPRRPLSVKPTSSARFRQARDIPATDYFSHIYLPLGKFEGSAADGVLLPPVVYDSERNDVLKKLAFSASHGAKHLMLANPGQIGLAAEFGMIPHGDYRLNVFNSETARQWKAWEPKLAGILLSPELILPQMRDITPDAGVAKGAVVYGRLPLMVFEKRVGLAELRDRKGVRFPILRDGKRDVLYNSVMIYMGDQTDRLDAAGIADRHFIFTTEDRGEVLRTVFAYENHVIPKDAIRRMK